MRGQKKTMHPVGARVHYSSSIHSKLGPNAEQKHKHTDSVCACAKCSMSHHKFAEVLTCGSRSDAFRAVFSKSMKYRFGPNIAQNGEGTS